MITGMFITFQCLKLDYPIEAAILSAADICDQILINDGNSDDGTVDVLLALQHKIGTDRVKIYNREWTFDRGFWARERNFLISQANRHGYMFHIAADECFHEKDTQNIRKAILSLDIKRGLRFNVIHLNSPNTVVSGKGWSRYLVKVWHVSSGVQYINIPDGCADDPMWPDGEHAHFKRYVDSNIAVYHYGPARYGNALRAKNKRADLIYTGHVLSRHIEISTTLQNHTRVGSKFAGDHPRYIKKWLAKHQGGKDEVY